MSPTNLPLVNGLSVVLLIVVIAAATLLWKTIDLKARLQKAERFEYLYGLAMGRLYKAMLEYPEALTLLNWIDRVLKPGEVAPDDSLRNPQPAPSIPALTAEYEQQSHRRLSNNLKAAPQPIHLPDRQEFALVIQKLLQSYSNTSALPVWEYLALCLNAVLSGGQVNVHKTTRLPGPETSQGETIVELEKILTNRNEQLWPEENPNQYGEPEGQVMVRYREVKPSLEDQLSLMGVHIRRLCEKVDANTEGLNIQAQAFNGLNQKINVKTSASVKSPIHGRSKEVWLITSVEKGLWWAGAEGWSEDLKLAAHYRTEQEARLVAKDLAYRGVVSIGMTIFRGRFFPDSNFVEVSYE